MHKLFLIGYYGYNNIGDEVLLSVISGFLKQQKSYDLSVLSYSAQDTAKVHNMTAISRSKGWDLVRNIKSCHGIIGGGGSILQDTTSSKSLYYYTGILMLGKLFGKRVYLVGNGFGPVHKPHNQKMLKWILPKFDGIIARDREAYQEFIAYGAKRVLDGVDCVFLKQMDQALLVEDVSEAASQKPYVAISLRPWSDSTRTLVSVEETIEALRLLGYNTILIPMKGPDDVEVAKELCNLGPHVSACSCDLDQVERVIAKAKFVIGMRLHALILSAIYHRPFIALSYDPKVTAFTGQVQQLMGGHTSTITGEQLIACVNELHQNYPMHQGQLITQVSAIQMNAQKQMETLVNWLNDDLKK